MTIKNALKKGSGLLKRISPTPLLDAEILLSYSLKKPKEYLYAYIEHGLSKNISSYYFKLLEKRKNHSPIAYLVKQREFFGNNFCLNENVLIPSQDSDVLVQKSLNVWQDLQKKYPSDAIGIWDIGTGSGCLIISLLLAVLSADKNKNWANNAIGKANILASDISQAALKVAGLNAEILLPEKIRNLITFKKHDIFSSKNFSDSKFHIIMSNPPYIPSAEIPKLQKEVGFYEPRIALDGHKDGLAFYRRLTEIITSYLLPQGVALLEMNSELADKIAAVFNGFESEIVYDLESRPRVIKITL